MSRKSKTPLGKYNAAVSNNIEWLMGRGEKYIDPDKYSGRTDLIDGLEVYLTQDGLCSVDAIKSFTEDTANAVKDYTLIRKDMFDALVWPGYAMSINVMRNSKFEDRLDMLLIDLYKFYQVVKNDDVLGIELINRLWKECDLARAYIYPYTFYWLRSFKNFDCFVEKRDLESYLERGEQGIPIEWSGCGKGFTKNYYDKLIEKTYKYKKKRGLINGV